MTNRAQLELFRERLPRKPYYSDELTTGLRIADVARALGARYIQPNGPTHRHWIVFDVDHAAATLSWDDVGAPAPNITVTNKANGHAHLIYGLDTPIRTAPDGNAAPLRYAAAIEAALREKLGADMGYSGLICKNPLHEHWLVQVWEPRLYDLNWLADYLDLTPYNGRKQLPAYGLGRNCTLFEKLASGLIKRSGRAGRVTANGWRLVLIGHQDITPSSSSRSPQTKSGTRPSPLLNGRTSI